MRRSSWAVGAAAFINPATLDRWEADHRLVQHADLHDYCARLIGDAMEATGGL